MQSSNTSNINMDYDSSKRISHFIKNQTFCCLNFILIKDLSFNFLTH